MKFFFLVFPALLAAQIQGVVRDSLTGLPVAYVNVRAVNSGAVTSADTDGKFEINIGSDSTLNFSAVGYKPTTIVASQAQNVILSPMVYQLRTVTIAKPKRSREQSLGGYDRKNIGVYYGVGSQSYLYGRFFPANDSLGKTPYLKTLVLMTDSKIRNAKFNVHFLEANPDGTPGAEMSQTNILGVALKGKRDTYIDLTPYQMQLPEAGFFVAIEILMIPENKYVESVYFDKNKGRHEIEGYAPSFATYYTETNSSWGQRANQQWGPFQKVSPERIQKYYDDFKKATGDDAPPFDDRFVEFAMQLKLTN